MSSTWTEPTWMHKAKVSDTSFLAPKPLHHGKMLKEKESEINKRNIPKQSILAVLQIEEFDELWEEMWQIEKSKFELVKNTSKEIDSLREYIIELTGTTIKNNPSQQTYLTSFLSFFKRNNDKNDEKFEPIMKAKFSNTEAMQDRILQLKRTKIELIQQTSIEIDKLRDIVKSLEYINKENKNGNSINKSKWNLLYILVFGLGVMSVCL